MSSTGCRAGRPFFDFPKKVPATHGVLRVKSLLGAKKYEVVCSATTKILQFVKGSKDWFTFQIRHVGIFFAMAGMEELTLILRLPATSPLNEGQCGMIYGKLGC